METKSNNSARSPPTEGCLEEVVFQDEDISDHMGAGSGRR